MSLTEKVHHSHLFTRLKQNVNVICLPTEHQRAVGARFKSDRTFKVELELELELEKPSEQRREPTTNSIHI